MCGTSPLLLGALLILGLLYRVGADDPLQYYILEQAPPNTYIGNIIEGARLDIKYDLSTLEELRFKFLTQPKLGGEYFKIEAESGILRTAANIDRDEICALELECLIKFDVAVQPIQFFQIIKVQLEIIDVNDNPPEFPQRRITHLISESAEPGKSFVIPAAQDPDSGANGIQEYELYPLNRKFQLQVKRTADGATDLRLVLKQKLDRERTGHYEVQVIAYDGGIPPRSGSILIDVEVQDANDNDPMFEKESYEVYITENLPIGTTILRVKAKDDDKGPNGKIVYELAKGSEQEFGNVFGINEDTGDIFIKGNLDYEANFIYLLSVTANDRGPDSLPATVTVVVHVEDTNDNPPQININTLTSDATAQVAENADPGTFVAHISVADGDSGNNGKFTCAIDNPNFKLEKLYLTEFKVVTVRRFDRERKSHYELALTCRDKGQQPQVSISPIHVTITDENDHSPVFLQESYSVIVKENNNVGVSVLEVSAIDDDVGQNGRLQYQLSDNAQELLSIDKGSGVVNARIMFDHETMQTFAFHVIAEDQGSPPSRTEVPVQMTILDLDDERPEFGHNKYQFATFENQEPGTSVGRISAKDQDSPPFNKFSYSLDRNSGVSEVFEIDSKTGEISTRQKLDREKQPMYEMRAIVSPDDDPTYSSTSTVTIYVADRNDNSPHFVFPKQGNDTVEVSSHATHGYVFARLRATDLDSSSDAKLSYHIKSGNEENTFTIDPSTGGLAVNADMSTFDMRKFRLRVVAKDGGEPQRSDYWTLKVVVRKDIPFAQASRGPLLSGDNLIIVLAFILATIFVAIIIICCIIFIVKRKNRREEPLREKEMQKMLPPTSEERRDVPAGKTSINNYVTTDDIERMKKTMYLSKGIGSEGSASDVNLNGSCLYADDNQEPAADLPPVSTGWTRPSLSPSRSKSPCRSPRESHLASPDEELEACSHSSSGSIELHHTNSSSPVPGSEGQWPSKPSQHLADPHWPSINGSFEATRSSAPFLQEPDPENASVGSVSNSDSGRGHSSEEGDPSQKAHRDRGEPQVLMVCNGHEDIPPAQRAKLLAHQLAIRKKQLASLLTTQQRLEQRAGRWDGAGPSSDRYVDSFSPYSSTHGSLTKLNTSSESLPRPYSPGIIPSLPYGSLGRQSKLRAAPKLHVHFAPDKARRVGDPMLDDCRHPLDNISETSMYNPDHRTDPADYYHDHRTDAGHLHSALPDTRGFYGHHLTDGAQDGRGMASMDSGEYRLFDSVDTNV